MSESACFAAAALVTSVVAATTITPSLADDASPWANDLHSSMRLIAGSTAAGAAPLRAGIEIRMGEGWKTYWRYPGDAGVPPKFSFAGSDNLRSAKVLWPAPHTFVEETGTSIGYKNVVVFPVEVTPREPGRPVTLKLKLDYAVCEKLCVPAEGAVSLTLAGGSSSHDATLAAAETQVPVRVAASTLGLTARRVTSAAKPLVFVDVAAPAGKQLELIVEGPTPEWALPVPKPAQGAPNGRNHFGFELDGLPPGVDPNKGPFELTFTVVGGARPVEVTTRLD